jgi:hypothetical protein
VLREPLVDAGLENAHLLCRKLPVGVLKQGDETLGECFGASAGDE